MSNLSWHDYNKVLQNMGVKLQHSAYMTLVHRAILSYHDPALLRELFTSSSAGAKQQREKFR